MHSKLPTLCLLTGMFVSSGLGITPAFALDSSKVTTGSDLTVDSVQRHYDELLQELKKLPDAASWIAFLSRWNSFKATLSGENSRRSFRENRNTVDPAAEEKSKFMREKALPLAEGYDAKIREAVLRSPFRKELEGHFGRLLFLNFEVEQSAFIPENIELNTEAAKLVARYNKMTGAAKVLVEGKELTLPRANALLEDPSEALRKAAWLAISKWTIDHSEELNQNYSKLVSLRQRIAGNLHEKNFIPVGYRKMQRTDYGPAEVKRFRQEIKKNVVPLLRKLRKQQASMLGAKTVKPWNANYYPGLSLPPNVLSVKTETEKAQKLFDKLHPVLGNHFRRMVKENLIDLENRPNKRSGAYSTSFDDEKKALIFCNNTGGANDVGTITHEMGHAFQAWESMWIEPIELRWPTYEACEVLSMGMEYLSLPLLEEFFKKEEAAKYRRLKLIDSLTLFPYVATVDEFQHWVYEHPKKSPAEREAAWSRIWDEYNVGLDFTGYERAKSTRWMRQGHIYRVPFYYIDYAIAETGALQLFARDKKDHAGALASYLKLCRIGGSQSVLGIFRAGELKSPFEEGVLAPLMKTLAKDLGLK